MKYYKLEIFIIILFIVILSLAGCASKTPCTTWQCEKQALRQKAESKCRQLESYENFKLRETGFVVNYHCGEVVRRMYP